MAMYHDYGLNDIGVHEETRNSLIHIVFIWNWCVCGFEVSGENFVQYT